VIRPSQEPQERPRPKLVNADIALHEGPADLATSDSSAARLKSFVERIERLQEEIDGLNADKRDVFAEARGTGFDVKVMKKIIRERAMDQADRIEEQELLILYRQALGMTV
jgi:uncharacterized protein (UPF0335 family)